MAYNLGVGGYGPNQHRSWWGGPQAVFIDKARGDREGFRVRQQMAKDERQRCAEEVAVIAEDVRAREFPKLEELRSSTFAGATWTVETCGAKDVWAVHSLSRMMRSSSACSPTMKV